MLMETPTDALALISRHADDTRPAATAVLMVPSRHFVSGCLMVASALLLAGRFVPLPVSLLASEVFTTILGLFLLG